MRWIKHHFLPQYNHRQSILSAPPSFVLNKPERDRKCKLSDTRQLPKGIFPSCNFPRVFSQAATSQGYFPKLQLLKGVFPSCNFPRGFSQAATPKGIFPSCNFPSVFSQAATSQVYFPKLQLFYSWEETVSVISCALPYKDGNARFTTVLLKALSDQV